MGLSESLCETSQIKSTKMAVDKEEILRICDIYDWHGKGELDMYYFMDIFYALGMGSPRRPVSSLAKLMIPRRATRSSTRLSPSSNKPSRSPNTPETTLTTLSCANCTTKTRMEPWCWLSSRLSCLLWEMKSPRMTVPHFSMNWQELRMKMVSSLTVPSWTNCAARHKSFSQSKSKDLLTFSMKKIIFKQLITCDI